MKRTIALLLALAMTLALCGCGKSEAVKSVEEEIASLDRVLSLDTPPPSRPRGLLMTAWKKKNRDVFPISGC